jgi:hypothetical protein
MAFIDSHNLAKLPSDLSWWLLNLIDPQIAINYYVIILGNISIESFNMTTLPWHLLIPIMWFRTSIRPVMVVFESNKPIIFL